MTEKNEDKQPKIKFEEFVEFLGVAWAGMVLFLLLILPIVCLGSIAVFGIFTIMSLLLTSGRPEFIIINEPLFYVVLVALNLIGWVMLWISKTYDSFRNTTH